MINIFTESKRLGVADQIPDKACLWVNSNLFVPTLTVCVSLMCSCATQDIKPVIEPESKKMAQQAAQEDEHPEPQSQAASASEMLRQARIDRLIEQSEAALLNGRLTLPVEDNAYDRFKAVLMLDSENRLAADGLNRVLLAYVARVYQALAAGKIAKAKSMIDTVEDCFRGDPLVDVLKAKYEQIRSARPIDPMLSKELLVDDQATLLLSEDSLSRKSDEVTRILEQAAKRVRDTDEGVMIYARSDLEGRWIYKIMKQAVDGYRIRGDIRIRRKPALVFVDPLEEEDAPEQ